MNETLFDLSGKVTPITGASSGLGAHFAKVLAAAGAKVAVAARRTDKLSGLVDKIESTGSSALAVPMDVTDADSVNSAIDAVEETLGPVTVLINNAGVADTKGFVHASEEDWDFVMEANLKGAWRVAKAVSTRLLERGLAGSIVNIASILGLRVGFNSSTYAISKAAVVQMTKAMALETVRRNIRFNAICPGYFETEMNKDFFATEKGRAYIASMPAKRLGELKELDGVLLLLASDASSFMTGTAIPVDGGHLISSL